MSIGVCARACVRMYVSTWMLTQACAHILNSRVHVREYAREYVGRRARACVHVHEYIDAHLGVCTCILLVGACV